MSKAVENFNSWHESLCVPDDVFDPLYDEAYKIDAEWVNRYAYLYRKDAMSDIEYAQALASIITEHECAERDFKWEEEVTLKDVD